MSRRSIISTAVVGATLVVVSCGGDDDVTADTSTTSIEATTTTGATTTTATVAPTTTTSPPTSTSHTFVSTSTAAPGTTSVETSTTTTRPTRPIDVNVPDGSRIQLTGDTTVPLTYSLFEFRPEPSARNPDGPATVTNVGPSGVCEPSFDDSVFVGGTIGEVCIIELHADATDDAGAANYRLAIELTSGGAISWTISSGPGRTECYEPGQSIEPLVLAPTAGSLPLGFQVGITSRTGIADPVTDVEGDRVVIEFQPFTTAEVGTSPTFTIGYISQGQGLYVTDEDMVFVWRVSDDCGS